MILATSDFQYVIFHKWDMGLYFISFKEYKLLGAKNHSPMYFLGEAQEPQGVRAESRLSRSLVQFFFSTDEESQFQETIGLTIGYYSRLIANWRPLDRRIHSTCLFFLCSYQCLL